jgi:hypothetical protein
MLPAVGKRQSPIIVSTIELLEQLNTVNRMMVWSMGSCPSRLSLASRRDRSIVDPMMTRILRTMLPAGVKLQSLMSVNRSPYATLIMQRFPVRVTT